MSSASSLNFNSLHVDQIGSLLRPAKLKEAFAKCAGGEIGEDELHKIQDEAIRELVAKQEAHNMAVVTDGEFRRTNFMESFSVVAGVEEWQSGVKTYHNVLARKETDQSDTKKAQDPILLNRKRVTERLKLVRNHVLDEYRFAQALTSRIVKPTLISADRITQCFDSENSRSIYPAVDEFMRDVVSVERQMISELSEAGCRYIGID
ncbi:MAG: hypothetical protein ACREO5_09055, partial [Candidatus Binatia bacterium]